MFRYPFYFIQQEAAAFYVPAPWPAVIFLEPLALLADFKYRRNFFVTPVLDPPCPSGYRLCEILGQFELVGPAIRTYLFAEFCCNMCLVL